MKISEILLTSNDFSITQGFMEETERAALYTHFNSISHLYHTLINMNTNLKKCKYILLKNFKFYFIGNIWKTYHNGDKI